MAYTVRVKKRPTITEMVWPAAKMLRIASHGLLVSSTFPSSFFCNCRLPLVHVRVLVLLPSLFRVSGARMPNIASLATVPVL
jgi:hypothetical protein